jgi:hypothetical protein
MPGGIRLETYSGQPVTVGEHRLVPFHQAVRFDLRLPLRWGRWQYGVVWNRPTAVWVQNAQGQEQVLPVKDVTRRWIWAIWGAVAAWLILRRLIGAKA